VRIRALGDFSVTYEVSGRLAETKKYLGSKSNLHRAVLDTLHAQHLEIVSPTFMNQRQVEDGREFIPHVIKKRTEENGNEFGPDTVVFDKADRVERGEELSERIALLDEELANLETVLKKSSDEEKPSLERIRDSRRQFRERLATRLESLQAEDD